MDRCWTQNTHAVCLRREQSASDSLISRGLLQTQHDASTITIGLYTAEAGRWAIRRGLPRVAGHRARVATVRCVVEHAPDLGIRWLTL